MADTLFAGIPMDGSGVRPLDADLYDTQQQAGDAENISATGNLNIGNVIRYDEHAQRYLNGGAVRDDMHGSGLPSENANMPMALSGAGARANGIMSNGGAADQTSAVGNSGGNALASLSPTAQPSLSASSGTAGGNGTPGIGSSGGPTSASNTQTTTADHSLSVSTNPGSGNTYNIVNNITTNNYDTTTNYDNNTQNFYDHGGNSLINLHIDNPLVVINGLLPSGGDCALATVVDNLVTNESSLLNTIVTTTVNVIDGNSNCGHDSLPGVVDNTLNHIVGGNGLVSNITDKLTGSLSMVAGNLTGAVEQGLNTVSTTLDNLVPANAINNEIAAVDAVQAQAVSAIADIVPTVTGFLTEGALDRTAQAAAGLATDAVGSLVNDISTALDPVLQSGTEIAAGLGGNNLSLLDHSPISIEPTIGNILNVNSINLQADIQPVTAVADNSLNNDSISALNNIGNGTSVSTIGSDVLNHIDLGGVATLATPIVADISAGNISSLLTSPDIHAGSATLTGMLGTGAATISSAVSPIGADAVNSGEGATTSISHLLGGVAATADSTVANDVSAPVTAAAPVISGTLGAGGEVLAGTVGIGSGLLASTENTLGSLAGQASSLAISGLSELTNGNGAGLIQSVQSNPVTVLASDTLDHSVGGALSNGVTSTLSDVGTSLAQPSTSLSLVSNVDITPPISVSVPVMPSAADTAVTLATSTVTTAINDVHDVTSLMSSLASPATGAVDGGVLFNNASAATSAVTTTMVHDVPVAPVLHHTHL